MVPAATCCLNSSALNPAPTFLCNGSRRFDASTIRVTLSESTRCAAAPKVSTSLSITNPGFTPVPTSATPQDLACESSFAAKSGYLRYGYASSSQVETTHDSAARQA